MKQFKVFFKNINAVLAISAKSAEDVPAQVEIKAGKGLVIDSIVEVK